MTISQLITKTILVQVLLVVVKVIFFQFLNIELLAIAVVYYLVLIALLIAVARRFGAVNYFEIFLATLIWTALSLVIDYYITSHLIELKVYSNGIFTWSYLVMPLVIIIFHKKSYVEARKSSSK